MANFGEILKTLRTESNMTQQMLADRLGVTKSVISYYELQERSPSPDILIKLTAIFHVSADYLLGIGKSSADILDVSGLTEEDIRFLRECIEHLRKKNASGRRRQQQ